MKIAEHTLHSILEARGMTLDDLCQRLGVGKSELSQILSEEIKAGNHNVSKIADVCGVPPHILFSEKPIPVAPIVDFRSVKPKNATLEPGLINALAYVEKLSYTFDALRLVPVLHQSIRGSRQKHHNGDAEALAEYWRSKWGLTAEEQVEIGDSNKIYRRLREFIENLGVMVIHYSLRTAETSGLYVQVNGGPHTIVINTTGSSKARKLFTLAHEFCHVILNEEGASNTSIVKNKVEKYCNKFAAYLLAPDAAIELAIARYRYRISTDQRVIRLLASNLGISQEALMLRLVEMGHLLKEQYIAWRKTFSGLTPPDDMTDGTSGGSTDPVQNKITQYGTRLISMLKEASRLGKLDGISIYRLSGLKPKYQKELFGDAYR